MTKLGAVHLFWRMAREKFVDATKQNRVADRDEWLRLLDRMEREWPWLLTKQPDIPGLRDIPTGTTED